MIEHKTVSLADQVFDHLENQILSGQYPRGEILTECKLSAELGVSRTPIRESLRRLAQEHLIEETGKGAVIIGITQKDLSDIFLIRQKIEVLAVSLAAENRTEEQLSQLRETLELQEFYKNKQNADQVRLMDNRFHGTLYLLSGSNVFYDTLSPLHKKIQKFRKASVESRSRAEASVAEHRKIYDAVSAKDPEAAAQATLKHIENAYRHIIGKD